MNTSRRRMREASRSLAIAFNIGQAQEALYRSDAGEQLDDETRQLFRELQHFFQEAMRGLAWTQATVETVENADDTSEDDSPRDGAALRSLSLVLHVVRTTPNCTAQELLRLLTDVAAKFSAGEAVDEAARTTFDQVLGQLARYATKRLDAAREERGKSISLLPLPE